MGYLVYCFTAPSGKCYVGQTKNLARRIKKHQRDEDCTAFFRAIKKYGFENFNQTILIDNLSVDEANYWEDFYIKVLNTLAPNGYNLRTGGRNYIASSETRAKMSNARTGHVLSETTKLKISVANHGKKRTEATKKKMSEALRPAISDKTRQKMSESLKGHVVSAETRLKISLANKGKAKSKAVRLKISNALKGIPLSDAVKNKRKENQKPVSPETRQKLSIAAKGRVYDINEKVNTSGHKGVYWREDCKKWRVVIRVDGKNKHLGFFTDKEEACLTYRKAAEQFHGTMPIKFTLT